MRAFGARVDSASLASPTASCGCRIESVKRQLDDERTTDVFEDVTVNKSLDMQSSKESSDVFLNISSGQICKPRQFEIGLRKEDKRTSKLSELLVREPDSLLREMHDGVGGVLVRLLQSVVDVRSRKLQRSSQHR